MERVLLNDGEKYGGQYVAIRSFEDKKGDRPVTAGLSLLFGRTFDQSPQYWLNLQVSYDLKIANANIDKRLAGIPALAHA